MVAKLNNNSTFNYKSNRITRQKTLKLNDGIKPDKTSKVQNKQSVHVQENF